MIHGRCESSVPSRRRAGGNGANSPNGPAVGLDQATTTRGPTGRAGGATNWYGARMAAASAGDKRVAGLTTQLTTMAPTIKQVGILYPLGGKRRQILPRVDDGCKMRSCDPDFGHGAP